jgi:Fic family protein
MLACFADHGFRESSPTYEQPLFGLEVRHAAPQRPALVGGLKISTAQRKVLLAHPDGFTNEDYRRLNGVDRDEAYRQIQDLIGKGILKSSEKPGRGAVYRLHEGVRQARAFLEQRLPMLRSYFAQHDAIKNADYQGLFGLTRHAATRELRRLVDEGFLRMEGERRGARYLPLPPIGASAE